MAEEGKILKAIINSDGGTNAVINNAYRLFNIAEEDSNRRQYIKDIITATDSWYSDNRDAMEVYDNYFKENYLNVYNNLHTNSYKDMNTRTVPYFCYIANFLGSAYCEDKLVEHLQQFKDVYQKHCNGWEVKRCGIGKSRAFTFDNVEIDKDYGDVSAGPYIFDVEVDAKGYHQRFHNYNLRDWQTNKEGGKYKSLEKNNAFSISICFMQDKIKFFIVDFMYGIPHSTAYLLCWYRYTDAIYLPVNRDNEVFLDFTGKNLCRVLQSICTNRHPGTINNNPTLYCRIPRTEDVNMNVWSTPYSTYWYANYDELEKCFDCNTVHGKKIRDLKPSVTGVIIPEHYLNDDGSLKRTQPFDTQGIPREQILYNQLQNIQAI